MPRAGGSLLQIQLEEIGQNQFGAPVCYQPPQITKLFMRKDLNWTAFPLSMDASNLQVSVKCVD